jgi:hypothetical protein
MAKNAPDKRRRNKDKAWLLGIGLDGKDGHTRITRGPNFHLVGGSKETHGLMQEKAVKLNEHLKARGKTLDDMGPTEFADIAEKLDIRTSTKREE